MSAQKPNVVLQRVEESTSLAHQVAVRVKPLFPREEIFWALTVLTHQRHTLLGVHSLCFTSDLLIKLPLIIDGQPIFEFLSALEHITSEDALLFVLRIRTTAVRVISSRVTALSAAAPSCGV